MDKNADMNPINRRNSTGNFDMEPTGARVLSRYLRGTTASCHDNCKFGIKQETTETKPINPFPKRASIAPADRTHEDVPDSVQIHNKVPFSIPKPARDLKSDSIACKDEVIKREVSTVSSRKEDTIEPKSRHLKPIPEAVITKASLPSPRPPRRRLSDIVIPNRDLGAVLDMSPIGSSDRRKNNKKTESRTDLKLSTAAAKLKPVSSNVSSPKTPGKVKSPKTPGNVKSPRKVPILKTPKTPGHGKSPRKVPTPTTPKTPKSPRKVPTLKTHNSFPNQEMKVSRKSNPTKPIEEIVPEKTLYVIEPTNVDETSKTESPSPPASSSSEEELLKNDDNGVQISPRRTEDQVPVRESQNNNVQDLEVTNTKLRGIRVGKLSLGNKDCSPRKLKFIKGKTLSPKSESSSPRKMQFMQGKALDEDQKVDSITRMSLRRRASDGLLSSPKSHTVKVVLKHQDMEEKKDPQGLINNVIEETASKLIQTRKSKVKALVGAFENLISITDHKKSRK